VIIFRRSGPWLVAFLAFFVPVGPISAQEQIPASLSLEEATRIALRNNPLLQADLNSQELADWNIRAAYGALLPTASANSAFSWQGSGEQQVGSVTLTELGFGNQPSYYFSSYRLGVSYTLDGRILMAIPQARAERDARIAEGNASQAQVVFQVTQAYLEVLRQVEGLVVAEQELARAEGNLRLTQGRMEVGSTTPLDVRQAEVAVGRARVSLLVAENGVRTAKFRLSQRMGLEPQDEFVPTTGFDLAEPLWEEEGLESIALERNPSLRGLRAGLQAQEHSVKMARSAYFPTLSISASTSGFAREASNPQFLVGQAQSSAVQRILQCEATNEIFRRLADPLPTVDCSRYLFTENQRQAILDSNSQFPFDFTRQPPSASLSISIPVFQGLRRQRDLEASKIARENTRFQVRSSELALKADIASGLANLRTAYEAALIEEQNQVWADEQLRLARERYQLGVATFLELVEAETVKTRADRERIASVFAYHDALASLESVVGTSLRTP
jgi:outer membrane protein